VKANIVLVSALLMGVAFAGFVNSEKPVVIWAEGKRVQYYFANSCIKPYSLARRFGELGIYAETWSAKEIKERGLDVDKVPVFVNVYGSTFPYEAKEALIAYHRNGGCLVSTGVPFSKPARDFGKLYLVDGALEDEFQGDWLGVGLAQDVEGVRVIEYRGEDDPVGLGYIDFAGMRAVNIPCLDLDSLGDEAQVAGIVGLKGNSGEGFAVALIQHSDKFHGAMDLWAGSLLFEEPYPSKVAGAEAVIVQGSRDFAGREREGEK